MEKETVQVKLKRTPGKSEQPYNVTGYDEDIIIKKIVRTLQNGLQVTRPAGNQPGDKFYLRLNHKRVNGKWRVVGNYSYRRKQRSTEGITSPQLHTLA